MVVWCIWHFVYVIIHVCTCIYRYIDTHSTPSPLPLPEHTHTHTCSRPVSQPQSRNGLCSIFCFPRNRRSFSVWMEELKVRTEMVLLPINEAGGVGSLFTFGSVNVHLWAALTLLQALEWTHFGWFASRLSFVVCSLGRPSRCRSAVWPPGGQCAASICLNLCVFIETSKRTKWHHFLFWGKYVVVGLIRAGADVLRILRADFVENFLFFVYGNLKYIPLYNYFCVVFSIKNLLPDWTHILLE